MRTDKAGGTILSKHDGKSGYRLEIDPQGRAWFVIASQGVPVIARSAGSIADGKWHHILAEVDRKARQMTIYVDGKISGRSAVALEPDVSLDNRADFLVAKGAGDSGLFVGDIDFIRVCLGTLADAQTDIAELYEWQTNGPVRYDFAGKAPVGKRDAGAIERR